MTIKKSKQVSVFPVGFVVIGLALSNSAALFAGDLKVSGDGIPTVKVDYSGVDLSTNTGATLLYHQLRSAAAQVCGSLRGRGVSLEARWKTCYNKALSDAVAGVNSPVLTALYQRQVPGLTPTMVASRVDKGPG